MRRVFRRGRGATVRDGTRVYPFLNPADSTNDLPLELLSGASVALGGLRPGQASKIHMHPLVTLVVWVISGCLSLKLKDRQSSTPYTLRLRAEDGAMARPGTFMQLLNASAAPCRVLYVVSPAYVFLKLGDRILYDDAIVFDAGWDELARLRWRPAGISTLAALRATRQRALKSLSLPSRSRGRRGRSGS